MKQLAGRLRAWWRVLTRSRTLEQEMRDEMQFHVDMEADRLRANGLTASEAKRQALVRFGGLESAKEAGRDARGRQWLDATWLEARLGVRTLWKHRGLTLVGGFAMAAAVAVGAVAFELLGQLLTPTLPFDPEGRIVAVEPRTGDARTGPLALLTGEVKLESLETIGAYRHVHLNLQSPSEPAESIPLAEMTSSGFALTGVPPARGRYLQPQDESPTSPPVIVIGHRVWQVRFASDPAIVGRVLVLSGVPHEVVGVMPEGFGFPVDHQFWIPFRMSSIASADSAAPEVHVFGQLAPDATDKGAAAELAARVAALREPGSPEPLQPTVSSFTRYHVDLSDPEVAIFLRGVQVSTSLLVFVVAINLAIVLYARTVRRVGEIAVRTALGASRQRILTQLFMEALALTATGAVAGLIIAAVMLAQLEQFARSIAGIPFWIRFGLSFTTIAEVGLLAALSALVMGVLPGLRATGRRVHAHLHEVRGGQGPRLGRIWGTLVIAQITAAVAILPAAVYMAWETTRLQSGDVGFPRERFSVVHLWMPTDAAPVEVDRLRDRQQQVMDRFAAEPGVQAVTFSASVPGFGPGAGIEFANGVRTQPASLRQVSRFPVATDLLNVYGAQLLAGRLLQPDDRGTDAVVVNETFVGWLANPVEAVGATFRYTSMAGEPVAVPRWHQIVGVVRDFPRFPSRLALDTPAAVYHPATPGSANRVILSLRHTGEAPGDVATRARRIAAEVDPALQIVRAMPLAEYYWQFLKLWTYVSWAINLITASALVLSAAGLYAMMAFIVAQRQREIGVRIALGATPRQLLLSIFKRALRQLTIGVALGSALSWTVLSAAGFETSMAASLVVVVAAIAVMVGLVAAVGPARRSLRVPVAESLRAET